MSNQKDGGPAFPLPAEQCIHTEAQGIIGTEGYGRHAEYGMTLRDYFAAKALQGLISNSSWLDRAGKNLSASEVLAYAAGASYEIADAMLYARSA